MTSPLSSNRQTNCPDVSQISPLGKPATTPGSKNHNHGPVAFTVGAIRECEAFSPPPDLVELEIFLTRMGQRLFFPPSVAGWPGGMTWLRGQAVLARANFAAWLTGPDSGLGPDHFRAGSERNGLKLPESWLDAMATLSLGIPLPAAARPRST